MSTFSEYRQHAEMTFDPRATAVLVVDMLNDFCEPTGAMPLPDSAQLYEPITELLAAARGHDSPVIWICDEHPAGDREFEKRSEHCLRGSWGAEIVAALSPPDHEYRVPKRRYSGFYETDLDLRLRELEIRSVILAGVVTNICVRSTVHDAFFRGYDVIVPTQCVAATSDREQESSLYDIDTHYGTVTSLSSVLEIYERQRGRP